MSNDLFAQAMPYAHDAYEAITVGGQIQYMLSKKSIGKMKAREAVAWIQSTSTPSSVYKSANVAVTHMLPIGQSNEVDVCQRLILQGTILNNDAVNAATLLPVAFQINRIEILAGKQLEIIYSQNLIQDRLFFSKNDEEILANQENEIYAYTPSGGLATYGTALAASAQRDFFLEIPCFITRTAMPLFAVEQQITINVYWNASGVTSTSSSQNLSLTQSRIYIVGYRYIDEIREKLMARYKAFAHFLYSNTDEYLLIGSQPLSSVAQTVTTVPSFSGKLMTDISIVLTDVAALQQNQYNWYALNQIDERDAGRSIYSDSLYQQLFRQMEQQTFYTSAPEAVNVYYLPHSTDLYNSVENCLSRGSYLYNSNISLKLLAAASATRDIIVCGHSACMFKISNGAIEKIQL